MAARLQRDEAIAYRARAAPPRGRLDAWRDPDARREAGPVAAAVRADIARPAVHGRPSTATTGGGGVPEAIQDGTACRGRSVCVRSASCHFSPCLPGGPASLGPACVSELSLGGAATAYEGRGRDGRLLHAVCVGFQM